MKNFLKTVLPGVGYALIATAFFPISTAAWWMLAIGLNFAFSALHASIEKE